MERYLRFSDHEWPNSGVKKEMPSDTASANTCFAAFVGSFQAHPYNFSANNEQNDEPVDRPSSPPEAPCTLAKLHPR